MVLNHKYNTIHSYNAQVSVCNRSSKENPNSQIHACVKNSIQREFLFTGVLRTEYPLQISANEVDPYFVWMGCYHRASNTEVVWSRPTNIRGYTRTPQHKETGVLSPLTPSFIFVERGIHVWFHCYLWHFVNSLLDKMLGICSCGLSLPRLESPCSLKMVSVHCH